MTAGDVARVQRCRAMAKARTQKLKVFRTPIGFHDAIVAAPSQKAALEAWGADSNLFAQGVAERVEEPELQQAALAQPGEVIRILRGSKEEQVAALAKMPARKKSNARVESPSSRQAATAPKPKRPAKPSRAAVADAEEAIDALDKQQHRELAAIDQQITALQRERRDAERRHSRARGEMEARLKETQDRYERDFHAWENW